MKVSFQLPKKLNPELQSQLTKPKLQYQIAHSTFKISLIKDAKAKGLQVSCSVACASFSVD
jgi:hypothetical protein